MNFIKINRDFIICMIYLTCTCTTGMIEIMIVLGKLLIVLLVRGYSVLMHLHDQALAVLPV